MLGTARDRAPLFVGRLEEQGLLASLLDDRATRGRARGSWRARLRDPPERRGDRRHAALCAPPAGLSALSVISSARPFLLADQLTAWHDLFQTPLAGDAILRAVWVSAAFAAPPSLAAWIVFTRRDVTT